MIAAAVLAVGRPVPVPRGAGAVAVSALLAALTAWVGLTMWWSIAPDLSWAAFDRLLVYGAFALLGLLAAGRRGRRGRSPPGSRVLARPRARLGAARQGDPVALPRRRARRPAAQPGRLLELARARRRDRGAARPLGVALPARTTRGVRAAGALLVYLAELVVVLTYSRAGIAVAALAALAWLAIDRDRLEALATLVVVTPVAGLVALWAFSRPALTDDLQPYADRVNDGAWFGVLALRRRGGRRRARVPRRAGRGCRRSGGASLTRAARRRRRASSRVAAVAVVRRAQGRRDPRRVPRREGGGGHPDPNRLADLSSSNRWTWWKEAWQLFEDAPAGGKGAGDVRGRPARRSGTARSSPPSRTTCRSSSWPRRGSSASCSCSG